MATKYRISPEKLADTIMDGLREYADLATADMKKAVKKTGQDVKRNLHETSPKDTGTYSKSWASKVTQENSSSLQVTVYLKKRWQLAHLLEFGHAKRGGGRVPAQPHIEPAQEKGVKDLEKEIMKALGG